MIQNDISNKHSPVTIIAAMTSKVFSKEFPTNVFIRKEDSGLDKDSTILLNQIRTIDKRRLIKKSGCLDIHLISKVNYALKASLELD